MKIKELLLGLSALTAMSAVTTSCTNEMVSPYPGGNTNGKSSMLVHAPDFYAWSGNQTLGTRSAFTRASGDIVLTVTDITSSTINQQEEEAYIDKTLPEEADNLPDYIDNDFLFYTTGETTVDLYPVFARTSNKHEFGIFYYTSEGNIEHFKIWDEVNPWGLYENGQCHGKQVKLPAGIFFGFYIDKGNTLYTKENPYGTDVGKLYTSSNLNPESYHVIGNGDWGPNFNKSMSSQHAVVWTKTLPDGTKQSYLGLEDWCDFDFQDLVFTLTPEVATVDASDFVPGVTTPPTDGDDDDNKDDNCGVCGHPSHDGNCDICKPGESDCHPKCPHCPHTSHGDGRCPECGDNEGCNATPGGDTGNTPGGDKEDDITSLVKHNDEVEVNFSINDVHTDANGQKYTAADLWTKLSIHVRKATDVEIFIPLPGYYLCESDDFAILQDHLEGNNIYTGEDHDKLTHFGETHSMTYTISNGTTTWDVTLSVTISNEGITVRTDGIDKPGLIEYLYEKNGDGINFEIWNYFQTETVDWIDGQKHVNPTLSESDYTAFQGYLDASTIEFLDEDPTFYINAFGFNWQDGVYSNGIRLRDCLVTPKYKSDFEMCPNFCYHLNGTPWNIIWTNKEGLDKNSDEYKIHHRTPDTPVSVDKY